MGYTTDFSGGLRLNRALTHIEWMELRRLANYDSHDDGYYNEFTDSPETVPDSYLQWTPNDAGTEIVWNGAEKFYDYIHWLRWLIKHYLKPHDLVLNGEITWQGEEVGDVGVIVATDNVITTKKLKAVGLVTCPNCEHRFVPNE